MDGVRSELEELKSLHDAGLLSEKVWDQRVLRVLEGRSAGASAHSSSNAKLPGRDGRPPASEAAARVQLAAAYRMAARMGLNEADQNHITLMCPTKSRTFLSIGRGSLWSRVTAGELLEVRVDDDQYRPDERESGDTYASKRVDGHMIDLESSAWVIHAPLHRARPDAAAILHTHMPYTTALASLEDPTLQMCNLNCFRFCASICIYRSYTLATAMCTRISYVFEWCSCDAWQQTDELHIRKIISAG